MLQNHLMQLLTVVAMEPPPALEADALRDEKVKVLRSIRPIAKRAVHAHAVRAQYARGNVEGKPVPGYQEEDNVEPTPSLKPTSPPSFTSITGAGAGCRLSAHGQAHEAPDLDDRDPFSPSAAAAVS